MTVWEHKHKQQICCPGQRCQSVPESRVGSVPRAGEVEGAQLRRTKLQTQRLDAAATELSPHVLAAAVAATSEPPCTTMVVAATIIWAPQGLPSWFPLKLVPSSFSVDYVTVWELQNNLQQLHNICNRADWNNVVLENSGLKVLVHQSCNLKKGCLLQESPLKVLGLLKFFTSEFLCLFKRLTYLKSKGNKMLNGIDISSHKYDLEKKKKGFGDLVTVQGNQLLKLLIPGLLTASETVPNL